MKVGDLKRLNQTDVRGFYTTVTNYIIDNFDKLTESEYNALDVAGNILAKQLPMTPAISPSRELYVCPICHRALTKIKRIKRMYDYCPKCGQRIYWGE